MRVIRRPLRYGINTLLLLVALLGQSQSAVAGTTGGLRGVALDAATAAPIAHATVTVSASHRSVTGLADAVGHFDFHALSPDIYTVTIARSGYQTIRVRDQLVFSDQVQTIAVRMVEAHKTRVTPATGILYIEGKEK